MYNVCQNTVILVIFTLCWRELDLPNIIKPKAKERRIPGRRIRQNIVGIFRWYNMSQGVQKSISVGGAGSEVWNRVYMIAPVKKSGRVRLSTVFLVTNPCSPTRIQKIRLKYLHVTCNYVSLNITMHHYPSQHTTTHHYTSLPITIHDYTSLPITIHDYPSLPITIHDYPSLSMTTHHYPSLSMTTHHYPSLHITIHHYPLLSITIHHYPSLHITTHHYPSLHITIHHYPSLHITIHHYP